MDDNKMSCIYEQIRILYDNELYSNVVTLGNLVLSSTEHVADSLVVAKVQAYSSYAESLVHTGQYRKAEQVFKKLQQTKKAVLKSKGLCNNSSTICKPPSPTLTESQIDANIRFQVHLCQLQLRQHHQALCTLQSIPAKQRTPRVQMALGKLLQDTGNSRGAIAAYKEVLKECPLALEAAEGLLRLGVKGIEVNSLMLEGNPNYNVDWLNGWIKAHSHFHAQEYTQAIAAFRQLDERTSLRNNVNILVPLGECYYYNGDNNNAMLVLQRAHAMEPLQRGLDILASILARERQIRELQRLVAPLQSPADLQGPEPWIALAYSLYAANKYTKAAYLAQKACFISPRNIEALLLKGQILLELKRYTDAVAHFREAQQVCSHRYETHRGLVDCYIGMHRYREALTIAGSAVKQLGQTPRSLTLYASVLMKDTITISKAKTLLKKALTLDKLFLPAVYLLAEIYEQEMTLESAISLLEKQVELRPTCKLHQMLADLLARVHEEEKALDHYSKALKLDPSNRRALEGMDRIDHSSGKLDSTYYMAGAEDENADATYDVGGEGTADSDNENDADGSETEAVWSDIDVNLAQ